MAAKKYGYNEYVQGSTVRKRQSTPEREEYRPNTLRPIEIGNGRKGQNRMQNLDAFSLIFMTAAVAVTLYFCISYIQLQHNITTMSKQIAMRESEINDLKNRNDAAYNRIETSIDLDYVYDVAVNELGMVRADKSQIIKYSNIKSDYVRQYGTIPEIKKNEFERAIMKNKK
ncbi:MAG: septum formation initiator family protein [Velocimicrobium sp.]